MQDAELKIQQQINKLNDISIILDNIGKDTLQFIDNNFDTESFDGHPWQRTKNNDHPIGQHTLRMRNSFKRQVSDNLVEVGTDVEYAKYFNKKRKLIDKTNTIDEIVKKEVDKFLQDLWS